jgi:hypothetical protein
MRCTRHAGQMRNANVLVKKPQGKNHLRYLSIDGRIILIWIQDEVQTCLEWLRV